MSETGFPSPPDAWAGSTWKGAEHETLLAGARLTLAQKLEWLEEAAELARRLALARESSTADRKAEPER